MEKIMDASQAGTGGRDMMPPCRGRALVAVSIR
jgi:hypothetical protein